MTIDYRRAGEYLKRLLTIGSKEKIRENLKPKPGAMSPKVPRGNGEQALRERLKMLSVSEENLSVIADPESIKRVETYQRNIENYIGTVKVPVGIAGPIRVNGLFAQGDYIIPLATTEAALVASYNRGAQLITEVGGCTAMVINEGVGRAPGFAFHNLIEVAEFASWVITQFENFKQAAQATTRYGKLIDMKITLEGNHVYTFFEFYTGDAAGQNMATIAAEAIRTFILKNSPVRPQQSFVEANLSGDKKASMQSFQSVRGKKVTCEVTLPANLIKERLHTTPQEMESYSKFSAVGGILTGTLGVQGHYANALAAIYLACGQDVACVAESAVGISRFEITPEGGLYASVTLPNLIVGSVGGGTGLPSQKACLDILGLSGPGHANSLAEVCASICLAGELSIAGALCSGEFTLAHEQLARAKQPPGNT